MVNSKIRNAETAQELSDIINEWSGSFDHIHTATAFHRASSLAQFDTPALRTRMLEQLAGIWQQQLPDAGEQELANVLWACSKLKYINPQLWSSTLAAFREQQLHGKQHAAQAIANVMYAMANLAALNKGEVPGVSKAEVTAAVCELGACMRLYATHPRLEDLVAPQAIANTLWACAKLRISPGDAALNSLLQALARPAIMGASNSQDLANSLWAVGELQQRVGWQPQVQQRVWERLLAADSLGSIADRGLPNQVSNALLAMAQLSTAAAAAAAAAAADTEDAVPTISRELARESAVLLLTGKVAQQLQAGHVGPWKAQAISNSMWACGKLGVFVADFFDGAASSSSLWVPAAVDPNLSQVAYACRVLQFKHPQLLAATVQRAKQVWHSQQQQRSKKPQLQSANKLGFIVGVVNAVAVLDMRQLAADAVALVAGCGISHNSKLIPANAGMLWDVHAWLVQHQLLDGRGLVGLLSEQQLEQGRAAAEAHRAQPQLQLQK
jgi:hypothetical protein